MKAATEINFKEIVLVTHEVPNVLPEYIKIKLVPRIQSLTAYSQIMFESLHKHVSGSHILVLQHDGMVHDVNMWDDSFLKYDYIGSPWPADYSSFTDNKGNLRRVGNGGFSLRSRRIYEFIDSKNMKLSSHHGWDGEDVNFGVINACLFEENGLKFPDINTAFRFGFETQTPEYEGTSSFGYHRNIPPVGCESFSLFPKI